MLTAIRRRLSYANVIATVALFVALGGSSYAALSLPAKSVGTKQLKKSAVTSAKIKKNAVTSAKIKKNAVTSAKIRKNAVTSAKIKKNAVTGAKLKEATLGQVPSAASADALSKLDYNSATVASPAGTVISGTVACDPGQRVVGGGIKVADTNNQFILDSYPRGTDGWTGSVGNPGGAAANFVVTVICASANGTS